VVIIIDSNRSFCDEVALHCRLNLNQNTKSYAGYDESYAYLSTHTNEINNVVSTNAEVLKQIVDIFPVLQDKMLLVKSEKWVCNSANNLSCIKRICKFYCQHISISNFILGYLALLIFKMMDLFGRRVCVGTIFTNRIGHLSYNTQVFLRICKDEGYNFLIALIPNRSCNQTFLELYLRHFSVYFDNIFWHRLLNEACIRKSKYWKDMNMMRDVVYPLQTLPSKKVDLQWTSAEEQKGQALLKTLGIDSWYVCMHARDAEFLNTENPNYDWSYHDFRDADINSYHLAIRYVVEQGGKVVIVRMGDPSKNPLKLDMIGVIDYSISPDRTDFGDVYLMSKCKFFLGGATGLTEIPRVFGVPCVVANWTHIELMTCMYDKDIFIPKRVWHNDTGRYLSLSEIMVNGIGRYIKTDMYKNAGVDLEDNTAEAILDVVKEMNEKLDHRFEWQGEDPDNLNRWYAIMNNDKYLSYKAYGCISQVWLRTHLREYLLE
jgi:putative glycosyltransferase (TIGR04372 family)